MNIHIQDPKVSLDNFDYIIVPEHDNLYGQNILTSKGSIHHLMNSDLEENKNYLITRVDKQKKIVTLIIGGPNRYYDYEDKVIAGVFLKIKNNFINKNYQAIIIPSMRTPRRIIDKAKNYFSQDQIVIDGVDKKAYLSALKLADHIVVTCDSTSMVSEAAITGTPIYIARMPSIKNDQRFSSFFNLFESLNIIKDLDNSVENWTYTKLNETKRVSEQLKYKIKNYDFS